jgi:hypothetical protein
MPKLHSLEVYGCAIQDVLMRTVYNPNRKTNPGHLVHIPPLP